MLNKPLVAIDIGSSSVKVMQLSGRGKKKLLAIGIEDFPFGAVVNGEIRNADVVTRAIRNLLKKMKINTRWHKAAISLGGTNLLIKRVLITPNEDSELSEQVFYEAQQHFQDDLDDMYFRWQELSSSLLNNEKKVMLMVGAKQAAVEQHLSIVRSLGMKTAVVDCDVLCIANMFDHNYPVDSATVVVVNVGAGTTQVIISHGGEFLYSREFYVGGNEFTNRIAQSMGIDFDNAEALKIAACSGDPTAPASIQETIQQVNESLVFEVQTTLNFYFENEEIPSGIDKVNYVFLVGGGAKSIGLDATMASVLEVPVQLVNPFQRINIDSAKRDINYLLSSGAIYGVSVGLALRTLNESD